MLLGMISNEGIWGQSVMEDFATCGPDLTIGNLAHVRQLHRYDSCDVPSLQVLKPIKDMLRSTQCIGCMIVKHAIE